MNFSLPKLKQHKMIFFNNRQVKKKGMKDYFIKKINTALNQKGNIKHVFATIWFESV